MPRIDKKKGFALISLATHSLQMKNAEIGENVNSKKIPQDK